MVSYYINVQGEGMYNNTSHIEMLNGHARYFVHNFVPKKFFEVFIVILLQDLKHLFKETLITR